MGCTFVAKILKLMAILYAEKTHGDYGITITDQTGNQMQSDIPVEQGGLGKGMRPMQTILAALCGCSAVDVCSILKKKRQQLETLKIEVDGDREQGKEPSLWTAVSLIFYITGKVDAAAGYRAVELSITKYCSVAETLRRAGAKISFLVFVNGEQVEA